MQILYKRMQMKPFTICPATTEHLPYVDAVVQAIADASRAKGTGLALRSHDYVRSKVILYLNGSLRRQHMSATINMR